MPAENVVVHPRWRHARVQRSIRARGVSKDKIPIHKKYLTTSFDIPSPFMASFSGTMQRNTNARAKKQCMPWNKLLMETSSLDRHVRAKRAAQERKMAGRRNSTTFAKRAMPIIFS